MSLARTRGAAEHCYLARVVYADCCAFPGAGPCAQGVRYSGGGHAADLDVCRDADTQVAALLAEQAEADEKVLPRVLTFVVSPEQEELIDRAVELASDGTAGRDRKAKGLVNLARSFLEDRDGEVFDEQA